MRSLQQFLHIKLSHRTICTLVFLWILFLFLVYLYCLYMIFYGVANEAPATKIIIPVAVACYLHKRTGRKVIRFFKKQVFVRR